ncbi:hypothetical protein [Actinokineospora sp. UTMC 2448]|uniref:hypothetical protein n=1 Tax=Actinokineospora sp. UTMC 2448 TaxID=2268449 RepID=UPI0021645613|nr:hypothetical protein [Actinokineospora sp. UTMC 2448]
MRRLALLLLGAITSLAVSLWAVSIVDDTAETLRDRATEAVLETAAARHALVAADRAVVETLASDQVALIGLGQDYTNQLAVAHQSLAKVAVAGQSPTSRGRVQLVAGLVAAYAGAVGQAHAHHRTPGMAGLGAVDLWYASRLLHAPDGVLAQLESLQQEELAVLNGQLDRGTVWPALLWLSPAAILASLAFLVLLCSTQGQLIKRFRRRLNLPLLTATALTALVLGSLCFAVEQHHRLGELGPRIHEAVQQREAVIDEIDAAGQRALVDLLTAECDETGCGATVEDARRRLGSESGSSVTAPGGTHAEEITKQVESVADSAGREWLVPLSGLLICGLVVLGLVRRLNDYRFRA